jgi:UrcA family protein
MNRKHIAAVVLATLAAGSTSVLAGDHSPAASDVPRVAVRYGDLNMDSVDGQRALQRRIERAARKVCPDSGAQDLRARVAAQQCQRQAIAEAMRVVGEQRLARERKSAEPRG